MAENTQDRLAAWQAAERDEVLTDPGSADRRRATAASRRVRWSYEDADRAERSRRGIEETEFELRDRALTRLHEASRSSQEASAASAALHGTDLERPGAAETSEQRDKRVADDDEFRRELGDA